MELAIDLETYSATDIKAGVHKYVEDPEFEILLFAYRFEGGTTQIVDLKNGEKLPRVVLMALTNAGIVKTAYNAPFEMACISRHFKKEMCANQWSCTMALAAQAGYPFGLDLVASILKVDTQKDKAGKDLIKYFCVPCKPTASNGGRTRNLPHHDLAKWLDFKQYCVTDVDAEQCIRQELKWFKIPTFERQVWALDYRINRRGVLVDMQLVRNAINFDRLVSAELETEMRELTGVDNPKSGAQLKKYILANTGEDIKSLAKESMSSVKEKFEGTEMADILAIREKLGRTSVRKFDAIAKSVCKDGRVRGLFQYYGAVRTGRWAGRNVQLQNLKRNNLEDLDFARRLVLRNELTVLKLTYDDVGDVLGNLIRTAFVASPGKKLIVSDLAAIEARIVAWLAGEEWRLEVFRTHGKIYEASAAMMFKIPLESVDKAMRSKGKIAELALGYQGALGALERMGGAAMGLSQEEMLRIVKQWRNANRKIVKFWYDVQDAVIEALSGDVVMVGYIKFYKQGDNLIIQLPSGRNLIYISARYNGDKITYWGMDQLTNKWSKQDTYGGKLVENITQAIARDVLTAKMLEFDARGWSIIMHVHDEIVLEDSAVEPEEVTRIMCEDLKWAPGLKLGAETFVAQYYQK